jgi:hypothetical protein
VPVVGSLKAKKAKGSIYRDEKDKQDKGKAKGQILVLYPEHPTYPC